MLFDNIGPALTAQRRPLPHLWSKIDYAGSILLPEIKRVNLKIFQFDEHWNVEPPPPPLKLPQRPAEVRTETKVSQGAICKDKGLKTRCQEGWVLLALIGARTPHRLDSPKLGSLTMNP